MHFARVIGTVVCTEKVPAFRAQRMLLLEPLDSRNQPAGRPLVAIDLVSAGPGDHVFYVRGREAANALPDADNPADAAIVGIVDEVRDQDFEDRTPALGLRDSAPPAPESESGARSSGAPSAPASKSPGTSKPTRRGKRS